MATMTAADLEEARALAARVPPRILTAPRSTVANFVETSPSTLSFLRTGPALMLDLVTEVTRLRDQLARAEAGEPAVEVPVEGPSITPAPMPKRAKG